LPRKYHRPPTVKRRKPKKTTIPYAIPEAPVTDNSTAVATADESAAETEAPRAAAAAAVDGANTAASREAPVKHITRDYGYVRAEVLRILVISGILITTLLIVSIFRH
jgi:hypothetical protein